MRVHCLQSLPTKGGDTQTFMLPKNNEATTIYCKAMFVLW